MNRQVSLPFAGRDRAGQALLVREAVGRDAPRYLDHMEAIVSETAYMLQSAADPLPSTSGQRSLLEQLCRLDNCVCLVATRSGTPGRAPIIGSLTLLGGRSRRTRHACHLGMGVQMSAWGRGVGGLLLDAALTWARSNPILSRVVLQVYEANTPALVLYRSRGFVDEGLLKRDVRLGIHTGDAPDEDGTMVTLVGMSLGVDA